MSFQKQGFIKLEEPVTDYLTESEKGISHYYKAYKLAYRAMVELGLDFFYNIQSVKLPVLPNKTVEQPDNYLSYNKIGVLNQQGEIIPLYYNDKLTTYYDNFPNRISSKTQDNTLLTNLNPSPYFYNNYWLGNGYGTLYGAPSGAPFVGSFKLDLENGLIVLDESFYYDYVMVEYVCSPSDSEEAWIPIQFKEAVISYIRWKDNISMKVKTHMDVNSNAGRRRDFFNDRRLAIARFKPFNVQIAYQMNMENQRLTVKT
jgi:hypothetical protein